MKTKNLLRPFSILVALAIILAFEVTPVSALPLAPVPISPGSGDSIIIPTVTAQPIWAKTTICDKKG